MKTHNEIKLENLKNIQDKIEKLNNTPVRTYNDQLKIDKKVVDLKIKYNDILGKQSYIVR